MPPIQLDPIPAFHEERLARIADVFADVRRSLGLPWAGELFEALAVYDRYLQAAWYQLKPNATSAYFVRIARDLRDRAAAAVESSGVPLTDHRRAMERCPSVGVAPGELALCFERLNPTMLLLATAVRESLRGRDVGSSTARNGPDAAPTDPPPLMVRGVDWSADASASAAGPSGTHVVSREFRALAAWPEYMERVRRELRPLIRNEAYQRGVVELDAYAVAAVKAFPYPFRATGELARGLGYTAAEVSELLNAAAAMQQRLCELTLQFAALGAAWRGGNMGEE